MKNPFRKVPMQHHETTIASLTKRGEQLATKRAAGSPSKSSSLNFETVFTLD